MKFKGINFAYILFILLFVLIRFLFECYNGALFETDLKGIVIAHSSFPFAIAKEEFLGGYFFSFYYYIIHFLSYFNLEILFKIFNTIVSILCALVVFNIGKTMKSLWLGVFLATYLALNHYFIFFSNQIAPFCLNSLAFLIQIFVFLKFIKKINSKNLKTLMLASAIYCLFDNFGIIYVLCQFFVLYLIFKSKPRILKKYFLELKKYSYYYFVLFLVFVSQICFLNYKIITNYMQNVAINLNSLYLLINEFFSPYLSFNNQEITTKSTYGMLYTYFLNPDIRNLNQFKILISLFYSSFLPFFLFIFFSIKAIFKKPKLRILFFISSLYSLIILLMFSLNILEFSPKYLMQFFFVGLLALGLGIFQIKDTYLKAILVFCLLIIQIIVPEVNSYSITINKSFPCTNILEKFKEDYQIDKKDLIIAPYQGIYLKKYYSKELSFFDFDFNFLREKTKFQKTKETFLEKLIDKNMPLDKKNVYFLSQDYLFSNLENDFLTKYFIENLIKENNLNSKIILFIDKLNQKIVSINSIDKFAQNQQYNLSLRTIDFNSNILSQNTSFSLYSALCSRTLYNFINILNANFYPKEIAQYKKVKNNYYKIFTHDKNAYSAIITRQSDYVFLIYTKRAMQNVL